MKKIIVLIILLSFSFITFSQKHRTLNSCPYDTEIKTLKFEVLDINYEQGLVAFKHIYEMQTIFYIDFGEEYQRPIECGYVGMSKYPYAGVILGIYDLNTGEYLKTYTIYKSCFEKDSCMDYALSSKNLKLAKQLFLDYGLNIENKPQGIKFEKETSKNNKLEIKGITFTSYYENDNDNEVTYSYLKANNKLIYKITQEDSFIMGSSGKITYEYAYTDGKYIVFLNKYFHKNNIEGALSMEFYHFSPVFRLDIFKN